MNDPVLPRPGAALVARTADVLAGPPLSLSAYENQRAERFRSPDDRRDYRAAHLLVRFAAARLLPPTTPPIRLQQRCPICGREGHGRPSAEGHPDLHLSLAHARGAVAAAAAWAPVGIDIEPRSRSGSRTEALWAGTMTSSEQGLVRALHPSSGFLRLWVRKESLVKVGAASLDRLTDVDLSALPLPDGTGTGPAQRWGGLTLTDWSDDDHVAAVAAAGPVRLEVWRTGA